MKKIGAGEITVTSCRTDEETRNIINSYCKKHNMQKGAVIRKALRFLAENEKE